MNIGMIVVCYNNYERFIPRLLKNNGGINKIMVVTNNSMGRARNIGVKAMNAEWILYFSADDILLPNALEEIKKQQDKDIVLLKFEERDGEYITKHNLELPNDDNIRNWQEHYMIPGYVAYKRKVWEKNPYVDCEFPNLPFIFQAYKEGFKFGKTKEICAAYLKRKDSHNAKMIKTNRTEEAIQLINTYI